METDSKLAELSKQYVTSNANAVADELQSHGSIKRQDKAFARMVVTKGRQTAGWVEVLSFGETLPLSHPDLEGILVIEE